MQSDHHLIRLSPSEIVAAFSLLSSNGHAVTKTDLSDFINFYFPELPDKLAKQLMSGNSKEDRDIQLPTLIKLLSKRKELATCTYPDLCKAMASNYRVPYTDGVVMNLPMVQGCVASVGRNEPMAAPNDTQVVLQHFDADNDGVVGVDDWKSVGALCESDPKIKHILEMM